MKANLFILLGLVFEIVGVGLIIRDEATPMAAIIKQDRSKLDGDFFAKIAFCLAKVFGSSNVLDQDNYVAESFPKRFWGFSLIWLGFVVQAIVILCQLLAG